MVSSVSLVDNYRAFAHYNAQFNKQVYDHVGHLDAEVRSRDLGAFFGSIEATLNHILLADRIWLGRISQGGWKSAALHGADLVRDFGSLGDRVADDFEGLRAARVATDVVLSAWVDELDDAMLASPLRYHNSRGVLREHALWIAVSHLFNHQTHHRGQVTTLLTQVGVDPGVTDFLGFALAL